ncbi:unnamed protein product [Bemisia tabaci]|uniref:Lipoprotein n=1 Tax=Bemisia tabaci TaxID=7038 RepID=A0A9P0EZI4_BEMTA|nr:unnamed protein product [Bemisia tabaci]
MKTLNYLCLCLLFAICACRRSSYNSSQGYSSSGYNSSQEYSGGNNTGFQQFCVKAFATITQIVMLLPTVTTGDVSKLALLAALFNTGTTTGAGAQFIPYFGAGANVLGPPVGVIVSNTNNTNQLNVTITNPTYQPISFVITKPSVILCSLLAKFGIFKDTDFQYGPALRVLYITRDVLAAGIDNTTGSNVKVTSILTNAALG